MLLEFILYEIWNKNKNFFGTLDAVIGTISFHVYNCMSIFKLGKNETLNLGICYISKFPQDGIISEHFRV